MNKKQIAKIIVLYFQQGNGDTFSKFKKLASELKMEFSDDEINYGIECVFFNNTKNLDDWQKEGGTGLQLYGLRLFVANALARLNKSILLDSFEDQVFAVECEISTLVSELKKIGIKFKKKWWQFWE